MVQKKICLNKKESNVCQRKVTFYHYLVTLAKTGMHGYHIFNYSKIGADSLTVISGSPTWKKTVSNLSKNTKNLEAIPLLNNLPSSYLIKS